MNLVLAVTGATGAYAAELLIDKSPWPVTLVASEWGREVCRREGTPLEKLEARVDRVCSDGDLSAIIASGSVPTAGMVILPCTTNMLAKVSAGICDTLIARAAHCHLKEQRKLVLCVRETPWTAIDFGNAERLTQAGGTVMPLSPPFYMLADKSPAQVTMQELMSLFVDRVLSVLGDPPKSNWETVS
jgi:4-hydroxy-3-polyprenylbenzoate decarboxylase